MGTATQQRRHQVLSPERWTGGKGGQRQEAAGAPVKAARCDSDAWFSADFRDCDRWSVRTNLWSPPAFARCVLGCGPPDTGVRVFSSAPPLSARQPPTVAWVNAWRSACRGCPGG